MGKHDPVKEGITIGQISKIQELIGAALRKLEIQGVATQWVLESQGPKVINEMVGVFRKYVEAVSIMIVRHVTVNRARSPQQAINATGRKQYVNDSVLNLMLQGSGEEADVFFFKLERYVSDDGLDNEYKSRGLTPTDPYALAAANEADPAFADKHPNGTHWKDLNGKWCHIAFDRWNDERFVNVYRRDDGWHGIWWFAGCRN